MSGAGGVGASNSSLQACGARVAAWSGAADVPRRFRFDARRGRERRDTALEAPFEIEDADWRVSGRR
jgi:hypothetical protein